MVRLVINMAARVLSKAHKSCFSIASLMRQNGVQLRKCTTMQEPVSHENQESDAKPAYAPTGNPPSCVNEVRLLGYVGADAKQYYTDTSTFTLFNVATNKYNTNDAGEVRKFTTWHKVVAREMKMQDFILRRVTKGSRVYISGSLANSRLAIDDSSAIPGSSDFVTYVRVEKILLLRKPLSETMSVSEE